MKCIIYSVREESQKECLRWLENLIFLSQKQILKRKIAYLKNFERPRQRGRLGGSQCEEDVEQRFPVVLLEHYLLTGLCSLRCGGGGFPLLARVLDQALTPAHESLRLVKSSERLRCCRYMESQPLRERATQQRHTNPFYTHVIC